MSIGGMDSDKMMCDSTIANNYLANYKPTTSEVCTCYQC